MIESRDKKPTGWRDDDSALFIADGDVFVPERARQFDVFAALVPEPGDGLVVELCCGAGDAGANHAPLCRPR